MQTRCTVGIRLFVGRKFSALLLANELSGVLRLTTRYHRYCSLRRRWGFDQLDQVVSVYQLTPFWWECTPTHTHTHPTHTDSDNLYVPLRSPWDLLTRLQHRPTSAPLTPHADQSQPDGSHSSYICFEIRKKGRSGKVKVKIPLPQYSFLWMTCWLGFLFIYSMFFFHACHLQSNMCCGNEQILWSEQTVTHVEINHHCSNIGNPSTLGNENQDSERLYLFLIIFFCCLFFCHNVSCGFLHMIDCFCFSAHAHFHCQELQANLFWQVNLIMAAVKEIWNL